MDEEKRKKKHHDEIMKLIEKLGTPEANHEFVAKWEALEKANEVIKQTLTDYQEKAAKASKRNRNILIIAIGVFSVLSAVSVYFYFDLKSSYASYSILPGSIREFELKYGDVWVNGNTDIRIGDDDSVISVSHGEVFIKKRAGKNSITINTPKNKVIVFAGNTNVLSRTEFERVTSLGDVTVFHDDNKVTLNYGEELRRDKDAQSIYHIQSPQYAGGFRYGKIAFENESLPFVLVQLANFYSIGIEFKTLPAVANVNSVFSKDQNPEEALRQLLPSNWEAKKDETGVYKIKLIGGNKE